MFDRLAVIVGKSRAMRKKILGALAYPCLLTVMCTKILFVLLLFVIPRFADMFTQLGVKPPTTTIMLLEAGVIVRSYWPFLLGGMAALLGGVYWLCTNQRGKDWISNFSSIPLAASLPPHPRDDFPHTGYASGKPGQYHGGIGSRSAFHAKPEIPAIIS
jgi:type II secretory pathway component PulF